MNNIRIETFNNFIDVMYFLETEFNINDHNKIEIFRTEDGRYRTSIFKIEDQLEIEFGLDDSL